MVPLGGHDTDAPKLNTLTWIDWGTPILETYQLLRQEGFTEISIVGASVSAALVLYYLKHALFSDFFPKHIFLVDPFIYPRKKTLYLAPLFDRLFHFSVDWGKERTPIEKQHWINQIPSEALVQLDHLRRRLDQDLNDGIDISTHTELIIYRAIYDPVVSPKTIEMIEAHVKSVSVRYFESDHHVLTRGRGRKSWTDQDQTYQTQIFSEILEKITYK